MRKLLDDSSKAWNIPERMLIAIWSLPFIVALVGILTALISKGLYKWFTREDGFAEDTQVLFYSLALVLSIFISVRLWRRGDRFVASLYFCLSAGLFFLIGEEINWGQRIVGWSTPESLRAINKQGETNVHNILGVGESFKWAQLLVGAYGTVLPLVVLGSRAFGRFRQVLSRIAPHYSLIPYFAFIFVWKVFRNFFEIPKRFHFVVSEYNEVIELILSIGFLLFMVFQLRKGDPGQVPSKLGDDAS